MRDNTKRWKLEVSSVELTILQIAVERMNQNYVGDVFTAEEIQSTIDELNTYKYIHQYTSVENLNNQEIWKSI